MWRRFGALGWPLRLRVSSYGNPYLLRIAAVGAVADDGPVAAAVGSIVVVGHRP